MSNPLTAAAPFAAHLNLIAQIAMGLALLVGAVLARRKQFLAHKYCQSSVVLLNLLFIAFIMVPSFHRHVQSHLPSGLGSSYYAIVALHALSGAIVELLALYVILAAGTTLLPHRLRFRRYKAWMRTTLALWWVALALGLATYYVWYVQPAASTSAGAITSRKHVTVAAVNFQFMPRRLTIVAGTKVTWRVSQGTHLVEADAGAFHSSALSRGNVFSFSFLKPGVYAYHCAFHGASGGIGMAGTIVVLPAPSQ